MGEEIHSGDAGTVLEITVLSSGSPLNISTATTKQFLLRPPRGSSVTRSALFVTDGTDGKLSYTTTATDLVTVGTWKLQAYVVLPTGAWRSDIQYLRVHANV